MDPLAIGVAGSGYDQGSPRWSSGAAARIVVEDLPRPLDAGERQRLRLHLVAAVADVGEPALLVRGERDGHRRRQRGDQHREDQRGAARALSAMRAAAVIAARSQRSMRAPSSSVSVRRTRARQVVLAEQRPAFAPAAVAREVLEVEPRDAGDERIDGRPARIASWSICGQYASSSVPSLSR